MAKVRFLWDNLFDDGEVLASSEADGFGVERIQEDLFLKTWRSTGHEDEWICCDLSSLGLNPYPISAMVIEYHNFTTESGDVFGVQAGNESGYCGDSMVNSGDLDESIAVTPTRIVQFWSSYQDFAMWRFVMDAPSMDSGSYFRIGRIFLGDYFEPSFRPTISPAVTQKDISDIVKGVGGQKFANRRVPHDQIEYYWKILPTADVESIKEMFLNVGLSKPFWICEDADDAGGAYSTTRYVSFIDEPTYEPYSPGCFSVRLTVEEER